MIAVYYAFSGSTNCLHKIWHAKMGYLSVFLKEQIIALTKANHNKRDVEQLLKWFAKN